MEISPTSLTEKPGALIPSAVAENTSKISSDFDTFLKMLTVQMQNQDPLNPVDSSDYAVQLATFSGVEQQVQTNDLLAKLAAETGASGLAQMASWVGMEARAAAPAQWSGVPISILPTVESGADRAELVVRDQNGAEVQRMEMPVSNDPIQWAGMKANGDALPYGAYSFKVISYEGDAVVAENDAETYSKVMEVRVDGGVTQLILESGSAISASSVSALRSANVS